MGQWVVSVPGLEPLHLTVTLTSRETLVTAISDLTPGTAPRAPGQPAGRPEIRKEFISGLRDAVSLSHGWACGQDNQELVAAVSGYQRYPGALTRRAGAPAFRIRAEPPGPGVRLPAVWGPVHGMKGDGQWTG
jgi:hypothetical protein